MSSCSPLIKSMLRLKSLPALKGAEFTTNNIVIIRVIVTNSIVLTTVVVYLPVFACVRPSFEMKTDAS